ncbi:peptidylprolyl isomerase [Liquorilactobacillus satsumensis]|uniref:Peptidyl-prolyl cis-trans isomerase n=1 Tax=Liquorilactobacillus satsumensis DSM 16230 = JCM 12392 TaxID=1423801 RepID=A0A0R1VB87_9LACO|nr:peptidylprolyl isomerase [Liquorilactobacillus satsumensis]KRM00537.1 peptidyl-prolyl cis-trans isomerase [Liquorilactobacillus satsumensis DSM 16230 = JCM 12392]MCC7667410.1 peptidylprolyl isomerase [Liquorilactobacillus satsumensis]MCP9313269.1 peptidylprolyl isomerase [Liquorilactobacillus satsumensis]MCP9329521.1 peptidylprolyl isomerase [Liquorilactobacillus satsumensis]MCP9358626.1 peptidylprolyl isomerase [Liquorilactobacillus satsumensis]
MNYPQLDQNPENPVVVLKTNHGEIKLELFPKLAPKTVENFSSLVKQGYYNGQIFHRVIPDFMIQGGDPTGTGSGGESIWGKAFPDEFSAQLFNLRGALSMANAGPNTNGSQFFIVQSQNLPQQMLQQMKQAGYPDEIITAYQKGGTPWLDHRHTVFGQVRAGLEVVDEIAKVKTNADRPLEDVLIKEAVFEEV